ncbi:hypothetical protein [Pandoravirus japonicus]|uniref:Uncharacterized protein n=1 Tax=Pandoravirus japonicus TaxID=2823154 RepID=A0A811BRJ2_9VIRU|nr:hypothetical protein [Pandoravirus japonicus]
MDKRLADSLQEMEQRMNKRFDERFGALEDEMHKVRTLFSVTHGSLLAGSIAFNYIDVVIDHVADDPASAHGAKKVGTVSLIDLDQREKSPEEAERWAEVVHHLAEQGLTIDLADATLRHLKQQRTDIAHPTTTFEEYSRKCEYARHSRRNIDDTKEPFVPQATAPRDLIAAARCTWSAGDGYDGRVDAIIDSLDQLRQKKKKPLLRNN